jgi:ribosome biogenesis protein MAK21
MAPPKRKPQKQRSSSRTFDESALNKSIARLDKELAIPGGSPNIGKRKRRDGPEHGPAGAPKFKKRNTDAPKFSTNGSGLKKQRSKGTGSSALLDEIKALGGDEDDLDLVANVDSDAEEEDDEIKELGTEAHLDDAFKNELAKFASSLGFQSLPQAADTETEESEGDDSGLDDEEQVEEEDEEEEEEAISPPSPQEETRKTKPGKLVSKAL